MAKAFRDLEGVSRGTDTFKIDPRKIVIDYSWNIRVDYGDLDSLTEYIRENGVPGLIIVIEKGGKIYVRDGFRRLTCVMRLIALGVDIQTVLCVRETSKNEADHVLIQLRANKSKNFNQLETGLVYKKWLAYGGSVTDLAKKEGLSVQTIQNFVNFAESSPEIHKIVSADDIKPTNAIHAINSTETSTEAAEVVSEAVALAKAEGKKRATKEHVDQVLEKRGKAAKKPNPKKLLESILPGAPTVRENGKVSIELTEEEYQQLWALIEPKD